MRYECQEPGFEGAFLEFTPKGWTRPQVSDFIRIADTPEWWALLQSHVTAVHLPAINGDDLTEGAHLTEADLDRVEFVVYRWFWAAVGKATTDLVELGEAARRRLWPTPEVSAATPPTQP